MNLYQDLIISLTTCIVTFLIPIIVYWLGDRKSIYIDKTLKYQANFLSIYKYLYPNKLNNVDWKDKLWELNIFINAFLLSDPNAKNNDYYNHISVKYKNNVLNQTYYELEKFLNLYDFYKIRKIKNYWKFFYKRMNRIQKFLINDFKLFRFNKENMMFEIHRNWNEFYIIPFLKNNVEYKEKNNNQNYISNIWKINKYLKKTSCISKNTFIKKITNKFYWEIHIISSNERINWYIIFENKKVYKDPFNKQNEIWNK